jgi:hypothetical protein
MDNIEKLLSAIKQDASIWSGPGGSQVYFSGKFLDTVGEIFEKHGFGTTKVYLINQSGRDRVQAGRLLKVIEKFQNCPEVTSNRAIGRYVIKTLPHIKRMGV